MPHGPLPEVAAFQAFLTGRVWVFGDRAMLAGSLTSASSLIRPWHLGQARTSTAKVRAKSSAHGR
jgi:hypothetical protein